jgi:hypothetical protein
MMLHTRFALFHQFELYGNLDQQNFPVTLGKTRQHQIQSRVTRKWSGYLLTQLRMKELPPRLQRQRSLF